MVNRAAQHIRRDFLRGGGGAVAIGVVGVGTFQPVQKRAVVQRVLVVFAPGIQFFRFEGTHAVGD